MLVCSVISNRKKQSVLEMSTERWNLKEKKQLLRLINKHGIDDYKTIARKLQYKSEKDVFNFLRAQKKLAKKKIKESQQTDTPIIPKDEDLPAIDQWMKLTSGLVNRESLDFSSHLSRVMSIIADYEDFPQPDSAASIPNYSAIYGYLGNLMAGKESPTLSSLDSAVVLEVLHSLLGVLGTTDTNVHRQVMKWKYQLITAQKRSDDSNNLKYSRKVIENDFTEFITQQDELTDSESDTEPTTSYTMTIADDPDFGSGGRQASFRYMNSAEHGLGQVRHMPRKGKKPKSKRKDVKDSTSADATEPTPTKSSDCVKVKEEPQDPEWSIKGPVQYIKRHNYTYRPPVKGPQVVLVMPPKDKPIVQHTVTERKNRVSKNGKYKSLGRAKNDIVDAIKSSIIDASQAGEPDPTNMGDDPDTGAAIGQDSESFVGVSRDADLVAVRIDSEPPNISHQEIIRNLNARLLKKVNGPELVDTSVHVSVPVREESDFLQPAEHRSVSIDSSETVDKSKETGSPAVQMGSRKTVSHSSPAKDIQGHQLQPEGQNAPQVVAEGLGSHSTPQRLEASTELMGSTSTISREPSYSEMEPLSEKPEFSATPLKRRMANAPGKGKKRKVFDKSRYSAFLKPDDQPEKLPKKPKLYSLNPFCVPISLLDVLK